MELSFDFWKILAGVAVFMLGMSMLEDSLQQLAGRPFKLFLRKHTQHKLKAIGAGAAVTALLQSSSIVNLMLLAFVGSGIIQMQNGLAMMLGSNIGTTFTSWIVATVGFEFNIESFALPLTGIAGIAMMLLNKHSKWFLLSKFFFGFSFLFVGLNFMKTAVESMVQQTDLSRFNEYPLLLFLFIGILITALIQASSATIALVLASLHAHAIELEPAMAIVLGAEVGTTIKLLLASAKGIPAKKQVALGNFLMNSIISLLIVFFLHPMADFITNTVGIKEHVLALVFFQTLVNIISIALFYPFLSPFGKFLESRFTKHTDETLFIHKIKPAETELAIQAMLNETNHFLHLIIAYSKHIFELKTGNPIEQNNSIEFYKKSPEEKYEFIKHLHGDILSFYVRMQSNQLQPEDAGKFQLLMSSVRNGMYAAKSMKDALHDAVLLRNSSNDKKFAYYEESRNRTAHILEQINHLLQTNSETNETASALVNLYNEIIKGYTEELSHLYKQGTIDHLSETEISTIINYNRELYTAYKSLILSAKDLLLNGKGADIFDEMPGFIR
nr:Na/Pi symporter [uncultured Lacibacter sp.]